MDTVVSSPKNRKLPGVVMLRFRKFVILLNEILTEISETLIAPIELGGYKLMLAVVYNTPRPKKLISLKLQ